MIPKRIFFYWGNKEMSWLRYMTLYSFSKFNPDWEIELYVSDVKVLKKIWKQNVVQDFHSYKGKDWMPEVEKLGVKIKDCPVIFDKCNPVHNSDAFRWKELATNGGFYSDMDILYIKPIEEYYQKIKGFQTGIAYFTGKNSKKYSNFNGYFSIGFMFSAGDNKFFKDVFDSVMASKNLTAYQSAGVNCLYNMLGNTRGIDKYREGMNIIPMKVVYPYRAHQGRDFFKVVNNHQIHGGLTIGIHWYAGKPMAQRFNNHISPETLNSQSNTMSHWLKYVLDA